MRKFKKKNIWLRILTGVLLVSFLGALVFGIVNITDESTTKSISPKYSVGTLDEETGVYKKSEGSIYTKNAFLCQGLDVTLDFDSTVTYRVFLYDGKNNFLLATEPLTGAFNIDTVSNAPVWHYGVTGQVSEIIPSFAKYARIVITPNDDESINLFEIRKYAKKVNITVDKDQTYMYENNMLKSLTQTKVSVEGVDEKQPGGYNRTVNGSLTEYKAYSRDTDPVTYSNVWNSNIIDVSGCEYVTVVCYGEQTFDYFFADKDKIVKASLHVVNTEDNSALAHYEGIGLWVYNVPVEDFKYFAITVAPAGNLNNYAIFVR